MWLTVCFDSCAHKHVGVRVDVTDARMFGGRCHTSACRVNCKHNALGQWHVIPGVMALHTLDNCSWCAGARACNGLGPHVIHRCNDTWYLGAIAFNALGQLRLIPWGSTMQCLGAMASYALGQWQLMPWCNGRGYIYWVILQKSFIRVPVGQMTEKDPNDYLKKFPATLVNYQTFRGALSWGSS